MIRIKVLHYKSNYAAQLNCGEFSLLIFMGFVWHSMQLSKIKTKLYCAKNISPRLSISCLCFQVVLEAQVQDTHTMISLPFQVTLLILCIFKDIFFQFSVCWFQTFFNQNQPTFLNTWFDIAFKVINVKFCHRFPRLVEFYTASGCHLVVRSCHIHLECPDSQAFFMENPTLAKMFTSGLFGLTSLLN